MDDDHIDVSGSAVGSDRDAADAAGCQVDEAGYARLFAATLTPYVVLSPDLRIITANPAYVRVTGTDLASMRGRDLFTVFPANPADTAGDARADLLRSLRRVRDTGRSDMTAPRRHDLRGPDGRFRPRFWSQVTVAVRDEGGEVVALLHRVEDVTEFVHDLEDTDHVDALRGPASVTAPPRPDRDGDEVDLYGRAHDLLVTERQRARADREMSETLQRSMLTAPPQPDDLQIAVRYLPAAGDARIGGDWYDAFLTPDGATCLVIGDAAGHDRNAAATMGALRNLLRGIAYTDTGPPSQILTKLDAAMSSLVPGELATAVLARVEQTRDAARAGVRVLRWSNAGHPPPLIIDPDGTVEFLHRPCEVLLGAAPHLPRTDHQHLLNPGSTVLLYTDGLVERRGADIDTGLDRLRATVAALITRDGTALDIEHLCDALLAPLATARDDDIALLVLHAHPQPAATPRARTESSVPSGAASPRNLWGRRA